MCEAESIVNSKLQTLQGVDAPRPLTSNHLTMKSKVVLPLLESLKILTSIEESVGATFNIYLMSSGPRGGKSSLYIVLTATPKMVETTVRFQSQ